PLSDIGLYQGKPKEASIGYAEKAIEIYRRNGDQFAENIALQTLAKVYYYHDDYIKAEPIARRALEQATELGFPKPIAEAFILLSNIHLRQKKYSRAAEMATEALATD